MESSAAMHRFVESIRVMVKIAARGSKRDGMGSGSPAQSPAQDTDRKWVTEDEVGGVFGDGGAAFSL